MAMASTPVTLFLPAFYTQDLGLGMAAVGGILMLSRFWDVVTDPVIGYLSDRTRTAIGRRKPWIIASVPIVMIAVYHLFLPPEDVDQLFLLVWIMVLWFGWTLFNIPYFAWGAELSTDYAERTRITGWRTVAGLLGTLLAIGIPAASQVLFGWGGRSGEIMFIIGIVALCLMPLLVFPAVAYVPEKRDFVPAQMNIWAGLKIMWANRPFRRLLFAFVFSGLAIALSAPLFVLFISHVIVDPTAAPKVVLGYYVGNLLGIPFWVWLAGKTDKHITWLGSITLMGLVFPQFIWLGEGDLLFAAFLLFVLGIGGGNTQVVPTSMKADVIDLDSIESGEDRAGLFFAAWSTSTKVVGALGVGISLPVLAYLGFDPTIVNPPEQLFSLRAWFAFAPMGFYLLSAVLVIGYPITRARHAQLRAQLAARDTATDKLGRSA
jgi:GPH family glycoside/pentoside/hexuronide:cation symporter